MGKLRTYLHKIKFIWIQFFKLGKKGIKKETEKTALTRNRQRHVDDQATFFSPIKRLIGLRTLKTALAIYLAIWLGSAPFVENAVYVVIGTVISLQTTVRHSFSEGIARIMGIIMGGCLGLLFSSTLPNTPLIAACGAIILIVLCNHLKKSPAIKISLTVFLSILIGMDDQSPFLYSFFRMTDTTLGITIGVFVNYFIARPNYYQPTFVAVKRFKTLIQFELVQLAHAHPIDVKKLRKELDMVDAVAKLFLEDTSLSDPHYLKVETIIEWSHDLRFHLKSLVVLLGDGHDITQEDRDYLIRQSNDSVSFTSDPLICYHLEKLIKVMQLLDHEILTA